MTEQNSYQPFSDKHIHNQFCVKVGWCWMGDVSPVPGAAIRLDQDRPDDELRAPYIPQHNHNPYCDGQKGCWSYKIVPNAPALTTVQQTRDEQLRQPYSTHHEHNQYCHLVKGCWPYVVLTPDGDEDMPTPTAAELADHGHSHPCRPEYPCWDHKIGGVSTQPYDKTHDHNIYCSPGRYCLPEQYLPDDDEAPAPASKHVHTMTCIMETCPDPTASAASADATNAHRNMTGHDPHNNACTGTLTGCPYWMNKKMPTESQSSFVPDGYPDEEIKPTVLARVPYRVQHDHNKGCNIKNGCVYLPYPSGGIAAPVREFLAELDKDHPDVARFKHLHDGDHTAACNRDSGCPLYASPGRLGWALSPTDSNHNHNIWCSVFTCYRIEERESATDQDDVSDKSVITHCQGCRCIPQIDSAAIAEDLAEMLRMCRNDGMHLGGGEMTRINHHKDYITVDFSNGQVFRIKV